MLDIEETLRDGGASQPGGISMDAITRDILANRNRRQKGGGRGVRECATFACPSRRDADPGRITSWAGRHGAHSADGQTCFRPTWSG